MDSGLVELNGRTGRLESGKSEETSACDITNGFDDEGSLLFFVSLIFSFSFIFFFIPHLASFRPTCLFPVKLFSIPCSLVDRIPRLLLDTRQRLSPTTSLLSCVHLYQQSDIACQEQIVLPLRGLRIHITPSRRRKFPDQKPQSNLQTTQPILPLCPRCFLAHASVPGFWLFGWLLSLRQPRGRGPAPDRFQSTPPLSKFCRPSNFPVQVPRNGSSLPDL